MSTITRYVLGELARVFLYALVGLTGVMLVVGVVQEAVRKGLPPAQTLRLLPFLLPEAVSVAVPVAFLLGATSVYSRMAGYNEVVAIKALGISPLTILWPAFAMACLLSFATVWLNDKGVSWGRLGVQRVLLEGVEEIAYGMLHTEGSYSSLKFNINVKGIDGRRLIRPIIFVAARGDMPDITVVAREATLQSDPWENVLKVIATDCRVEMGNGSGSGHWPELELPVPLSDASRADERSRSPSCLALWRIPGEIVTQKDAIGRHEEDMAATAAFQMLTGDFDSLTGPGWGRHLANADEMRTRLCRLQTEPYRRWSWGFSCLFFVWVGAPMAMWLRNKDFLTSFFLCFAPILVVYYPLLAYGIDGAKSGTIPPISVWAGNVVLAVAGAWLLRKVLRY